MRYVIVAFALMLSSCSTVKIAYGYADTLIEGFAERYLDLTDAQEALVDAETARYMAWHRRAMLPRYVAYLRDIADTQANRKFNRAAFEQSARRGEDLWKDTARGGVEAVSKVLATQTTPERLEHLRARWLEREQEMRKEYGGTAEERREKGVERIVDSFEFFTGDLEPFQVAIIEKHAKKLDAYGGLWEKNRVRRRQEFLSFMANQPGAADIQAFLTSMLEHPEQFQDPAYRPVAAQARRDIEDLVYDVLASLTPDQRDTFVDTLRGYADDLSDLTS